MKISLLWTIIISCIVSVSCQDPLVTPAKPNLSKKWVNNIDLGTTWFDETSNLRSILNTKTSIYGVEYACGFYCNNDTNSCLFAVVIVQTYIDFGAEVVWSANPYHPVKTNATVELTDEGDLVLTDVDGTFVWSTSTSGRSSVGLNLTEMGNFLLFDSDNSSVWQSFDHPTDCWLPGQILVYGMNLTSTSQSDNTFSYSLSMTDQGLEASILSDPPQVYFQYNFQDYEKNNKKKRFYVKFENGSLVLYRNGVELVTLSKWFNTVEANSSQYMKLGDDGHLRVFERGNSRKEVADIFSNEISDCSYPMACGRYGVCSNGQCRCPSPKFFNQTNEMHADLGCYPLTPLICNSSNNHTFVEVGNVTYFDVNEHIIETDQKDVCKQACLNNCSCKAVVFVGTQCRMLSEIFTIMEPFWAFSTHPSVFIKVEIAPTVANRRKTDLFLPIFGSTLGVICLAVVVGIVVFLRRRRRSFEEVEEEYLDLVPGMPTRFSMEELATATDNFNKKLGQGGFGCVFQGTLIDGTRVAVKRLDDVGHIKKSFLAEVQSIGSIHHVNLVRLIGFCAEKSHRLLVYEYMCNGSLDRWIYCRGQETTLDWSHRRKIILDIAKGLAYLHEDCWQKIIHLDIKPQNILLDEHYNAKLADFGLAKLVDKDQSRVVTTMRGTPGYLAPEWLSAEITEKVDVYSFGVVILEIVCGRKIFEQSREEGDRYLPTLFKRKAMEEQWLDLVDKCCLDVESNVAQVEEMLRISAWCLQGDHEKRPSMSVVMKVLEGVMDVQKDIDYNFLVPKYLMSRTSEVSSQDTTALLPSLLSGPR